MFNVSPNGIIEVNRGDSFTTTLAINMGSVISPLYYDLQDGDFLYFAVLEANQKFEDALIKKVIDKNKYDYVTHEAIIRFEPDDTLHVIPGTYFYEVKLFRPAKNCSDSFDNVETIVTKRKFTILE